MKTEQLLGAIEYILHEFNNVNDSHSEVRFDRMRFIIIDEGLTTTIKCEYNYRDALVLVEPKKDNIDAIWNHEVQITTYRFDLKNNDEFFSFLTYNLNKMFANFLTLNPYEKAI